MAIEAILGYQDYWGYCKLQIKKLRTVVKYVSGRACILQSSKPGSDQIEEDRPGKSSKNREVYNIEKRNTLNFESDFEQ